MKTVLNVFLFVIVWFLILVLSCAIALFLGGEILDGITAFIVVFLIWYSIKAMFWIFRRVKAKQQFSRLINYRAASRGNSFVTVFQKFIVPSNYEKHLRSVIKFLNQNNILTQDAVTGVPWVLHLNFSNDNWLDADYGSRPELNNAVLKEHDFCRWYPVNQQLIVDLKSSLFPRKTDANEELAEFLEGIQQLGRAYPFDSMVITVDLKDDFSERIDSNLQVARKMHHIMQAYCGVNLPMHIVFAGLDSVAGLNEWIDLPVDKPKSLSFMATHHNQHFATVASFFNNLSDRITSDYLSCFYQQGYSSDLCGIPASLSVYQTKLQSKVSSILAHNNFQGRVRLCGIHAVLGKQHNFMFASDLLEKTWLISEPAYIVDMVKPTKQYQLAVPLVFSACTLAAFLLITTYMTDKSELQRITKLAKNLSDNPDRFEKSYSNLQNMNELLSRVDALSLSYWLLPEGADNKFSRVEKEFLSQIERLLNFQQVNIDIDGVVSFSKIDLKVRQLSYVKAIINGADHSDLIALAEPYSSEIFEEIDSTTLAAVNQFFIDYLLTHKSNGNEKLLLATQQNLGNEIMRMLKSDPNQNWLLEQVNTNLGIRGISYADYWVYAQGSLPSQQISPIFTAVGYEFVNAYLETIDTLLASPIEFEGIRSYFNGRYKENYLNAWRSFLLNFHKGADGIKGKNNWIYTISDLSTSKNIYTQLLAVANENLATLELESDPLWLELVKYYQDLQMYGNENVVDNSKRNNVLAKMLVKIVGSTGAIGKAIAGQSKSAMKSKKKIDKASGPGPGKTERELQIEQAAQELDTYRSLINDLIFNIDNRSQSFNNYKAVLMAAKGQSSDASLVSAQKSMRKLQNLIGRPNINTKPFWNIFEGTENLLMQFMSKESACYLNENWAEEVLLSEEFIPKDDKKKVLFGEEGIVWDYVDEQLSPFLNRKAGVGYVASKDLEQPNYLSIDLLKTLSSGLKYKFEKPITNVLINLTSLPTNVNYDAQLFVSRTDIVLNCPDELQRISNKNFTLTENLSYSDTCRSTGIHFKIGNRLLVVDYQGHSGFVDFLEDFADGTHTFSIEEFPRDFYALESFNVSEIRVNLEINDVQGLIKRFKRDKLSVPKEIALCEFDG